MVKPLITGSFMDMQHVNNWDAQYWIDECREWKDENWEALVDDMHEIGIDTVMILGCALWGRPMYPADRKTVGIQLPMGSKDPLGCVIKAAEKNGMDVYPGLGFFGRCSIGFNTDVTPEHDRWLVNMAEDIMNKYGQFNSLKGFYLSSEMSCIREGGLFVEEECKKTVDFVKLLRSRVGRVTLIISPDNLKIPLPEQMAKLEKQLQQLNIDVFAYQDHAGFNWSYEDAAKGFNIVGRIHHKLKQQLWVNCEVFGFDKRPDGRNVCIPADFERIRKQLLAAAPVADKIVIYQYQGIMNKRSDAVNIGAPGSEMLYNSYLSFRNSNPAAESKDG